MGQGGRETSQGLAGGGVEQVRGSKAHVLSGYVLGGTGRGCVP